MDKAGLVRRKIVTKTMTVLIAMEICGSWVSKCSDRQ